MGREHLSDTGGMSERISVTFIVLFEGSDSEGLEVTNKSIESQENINSNVITCTPEQITEAKQTAPDQGVVIIIRAGDKFYTEFSAQEIAKEISESVGCVYTDSIIKDSGDELPQLMFPFSVETISSGYMITNVAVSAALFKTIAIREKANFLIGHDIISKSFQLSKVRHLAECKFIIPSRKINIQQELQEIGVAN